MLKLHDKPYDRVMDSFREMYEGNIANKRARLRTYMTKRFKQTPNV